MKVIAINDSGGYLIIFHPKLELSMWVEPNNFITLEEWRELQIDKII